MCNANSGAICEYDWQEKLHIFKNDKCNTPSPPFNPWLVTSVNCIFIVYVCLPHSQPVGYGNWDYSFLYIDSVLCRDREQVGRSVYTNGRTLPRCSYTQMFRSCVSSLLVNTTNKAVFIGYLILLALFCLFLCEYFLVLPCASITYRVCR